MIVGKIRRWGNSYGILLSKEVLRQHDLHEDEDVIMEIKKKNALEELFGLLSFKGSVEKLMREVKDGYDD